MAWSSIIAIFCLSISILLYAIFILVEVKVASNPFAPGRIIFERSLVAAYLCNFFSTGASVATIFYVPLYFQVVGGFSATQAGLRLIPGTIGSVTGSIVGGLIMERTGKYYWLTIIAIFIHIVGGNVPTFLLSGLALNSTEGIIIGQVFWGFGGGVTTTSTLIALIANADARDQAVVTACSYLFRSLGSVLSLSLSATVVQQSLRAQLREVLPDGKEADKIVERVRQSLDYINELEPHMRELVRVCYQRATNAAFGLSVMIVCLALVSASFIRENRLSNVDEVAGSGGREERG